MFSYKTYLAWLFGSLAVSIGLQMLLPFPFGLGAALALFIMLPFIMKKMATRHIGAGYFGGVEGRIQKTCVACGRKSSGRECGRCGSTSFKMG